MIVNHMQREEECQSFLLCLHRSQTASNVGHRTGSVGFRQMLSSKKRGMPRKRWLFQHRNVNVSSTGQSRRAEERRPTRNWAVVFTCVDLVSASAKIGKYIKMISYMEEEAMSQGEIQLTHLQNKGNAHSKRFTDVKKPRSMTDCTTLPQLAPPASGRKPDVLHVTAVRRGCFPTELITAGSGGGRKHRTM